jgi:hypothetical protein
MGIEARSGRFPPDYDTPSQFAAFVRDEIAKFGDIIQSEFTDGHN